MKNNNHTQKVTGPAGTGSYFFRRGISFAGDFYLTNRLSVLIAAIIYGFFHGGDIKVITAISDLPWVQVWTILAAVFVTHYLYFVMIPCYGFDQKGQTLIQRVCQIGVVNQDKSKPSLLTYSLRYIVGCLLLEGLFYDYTAVFKNAVLTKLFTNNVNQMDLLLNIPLFVLCGYSLIHSFYDRTYHATLHDQLFHTCVVDYYQPK